MASLTKHQPEHTYFDRVPPQALPLEEAVLGALLIDSSALGIVEDILTPDCFYLDKNRQVYEAAMYLVAKSYPVDILTVTERLKASGSSVEPYYVVELTNRVASGANVEYHARILKQKAIQRKQIDTCRQGLAVAYDDTIDPFEALESLEKSVFDISNNLFSRAANNIGHFALDALKAASKAMESKGMSGVPSGLHTVDRQTGGWQNTDLIILAARPGMGKTSFAMQCAQYAAESGFPAMFFSLEMSGTQLAQRAISQRVNTIVQAMRTGKLTDRDWKDLQEAAEWFQSLPLYIDDTPGISISELRSKARKAVASKGVKFIVIDYLQLMNDPSNNKNANREQEIGSISRKLKALAKELDVPVMALSQLSRAVETRGGAKRPMLSDLRESGSLEQDADAVCFLYRPDYYGIFEDENGANVRGQCEFIFGKHRNGGVGSCDENLGFQDHCTRFYNLSETQYLVKPESKEAQPFPVTRQQIKDGEDIPF